MKKFCEVEGCGEELSEGAGTHGGMAICGGCRSALYYWRKQGPRAAAARRERLIFFSARMDYLAPHVGRMLKAARARLEDAQRVVADARKGELR